LYRQVTKAPKKFDTAPFSNLYVQKPNRRFLFLPVYSYVWLYQIGKHHFSKEKFENKLKACEERFDRKIAAAVKQKRVANLHLRKQQKVEKLTNKIEHGNNFMQWGEPLVLYDSAAAAQTIQRFDAYLFNKGYFKGKASAEAKIIKLKKQLVQVTYRLTPGPPYRCDTIFYRIEDKNAEPLLRKNQAASALHKGDLYDQDNLNKERDRIDELMKNNGFYDFNKQYITFSVDTAYKTDHRIALQIDIANPPNKEFHKQFHLDSVRVTTDASVKPPLSHQKRRHVPFENLMFNYYKKQYNHHLLSDRIFVREDSLYNRSRTFATQRQLANLDIFKFVNVNYDTTGGRFIANIFASPLDVYQWSQEVGVTVVQGYPGPYYNAGLKKRNLFGGMEILELNGRVGWQGTASATNQDVDKVLKSIEAGANASVTFPQFLFPFSRAFTKTLGFYNPKTKLLAGYTLTERPEYQRSIVTVTGTYTWDMPGGRSQFSFAPVNISIIKTPYIRKDFSLALDSLEKQGNKLKNAFNPSYVSSMIFMYTWSKNQGSNERHGTYLRAAFETGGTTLDMFKKVYSIETIRRSGLEPYQFIRLSLDWRKNFVINKTTSLAWHLNTGIGHVYSPNDVLPYEKNFFAGGSNSVRAWRPRRLGPGGAPPPVYKEPEDKRENGHFNYNFERPGEVLIEGSVEFRRKLIGFLSYAFFADAGNVWALKSAPSPQARFDPKTFYKQFGVGTGFGLRFDFTFLIVRFDIGIKVWDPAREPHDRFMLSRMRFFKPFSDNREPVIFNFGIGYPF